MRNHPSTSPLLISILAAAIAGWTAVPCARAQQPIPRAEPVNEEPVPVRPATPVRPAESGENTVPAAPTPTPSDSPPPADPPGAEPRARTQADDLIEFADLLYSQKNYEQAARRYSAYINEFPNGKQAQTAWYRLGESYLKMGQAANAEKCWAAVLRGWKSGSYVAPAAYRLGALEYNKNNLKGAIPHFQTAFDKATIQKLKIQAGYYHARCLMLDGQTKSALPAFEKVAAIEGENPFREEALINIGRIHFEGNDGEKALPPFQGLLESVNPGRRAEASARVGLILSDQGKREEANEIFKKLFDIRGEDADHWKPLARFGLIQNFYADKKYSDVVASYRATAQYPLPEANRSKLLLMVGNAFRFEKQFAKAAEVYGVIAEFYRDMPEGQESAYQRLVCRFQLKDRGLPPDAAKFISEQRQINAASETIDMAFLLKAETEYLSQAYGQAAKSYEQIRLDKISESLRADVLYKQGWAAALANEHNAAVAPLGKFIELYPGDPRAAKALARRGLSYKAIEDYPSAEKEFGRIIKEFPDAPELELALQQSALVKGQQKNHKGMVEDFEALIAKFPDSKGAAEAHYWIGWGNFEQENYKAAVAPLQKSRELDPANYLEKSTLRAVMALYYLKKPAELAKECDILLKEGKESTIPDQILSWLGEDFFQRDDLAEANRYFTYASTPEDPSGTSLFVWNRLAEVRFRLGSFGDSLKAAESFLKHKEVADKPQLRASGLLHLGRAQLGLKEYRSSHESAREGLQNIKAGKTNAELFILQGDIYMAEGQFKEAAASFIVPSQVFSDPNITPIAMAKAIHALEAMGDNQRAAEIKGELQKLYPDFQMPAAPAGQ